MPQLSPLNWLMLMCFFWSGFILLMLIFWWNCPKKMKYSISNIVFLNKVTVWNW
uniref:ATP synthase F0 subunit 8 n=1 Tax=Graptacme eborea TaxID=55752 RepID=Q68SQ0_GRAEB|nr:ATP synthase F0 subunit 8 [Graptacme eborea]AAT98391.1 ATP synthase F0 subunit 8 [Graptacme eborea]